MGIRRFHQIKEKSIEINGNEMLELEMYISLIKHFITFHNLEFLGCTFKKKVKNNKNDDEDF